MSSVFVAAAACCTAVVVISRPVWGVPVHFTQGHGFPVEVTVGAPASLAGVFVSLWPLLMAFGAALSALAAVLQDKQRNTVMQMALTPVSRRAIAAARILPCAEPFMWGTLAALPLYLWTGGSGLLSQFLPVPTLTLAWPVRALGALVPDQWFLAFWPTGCVFGLLCLLLDASVVWMAAHWGAACALRAGTYSGALLRLVGQALALAFAPVVLLYLGITSAPVWRLGFPEGPVSLGFYVLLVAGFLIVWWMFPMRETAQRAVSEFGHYSRLARDGE